MDSKAKLANSFLGDWIVTNVHPAGHKPVGDLAEAKVLAGKCVALASAQDLTRQDFEAQFGDLDEHMRKAQNIAQKASEAMSALADGQKL